MAVFALGLWLDAVRNAQIGEKMGGGRLLLTENETLPGKLARYCIFSDNISPKLLNPH
jgi:hypothetical protein